MMVLRDYQESLLSDILTTLEKVESLCVQLSTGGGKTVIFTEMIKRLDSKTLILVDGEELLQQTVNTFAKKGLDIGGLRAGAKEMPCNMVVVAMIETLNNRVKKNPDILDPFKYCVIDECHVWRFNKVFPFLKNAKRIGFTATPVRLKRNSFAWCPICKSKEEDCDHDKVEASEVETMAEHYDEIVCGKPINWLMQNNYLAPLKTEYIMFDDSVLRKDGSGEFTASSMKKVLQNEIYQKSLLDTYEEFCIGKKTLLFTSSTETNEMYSRLFADYNVKTYDSVNNKATERNDIVEWFRSTKDALLINTGCFTKGFDVDDVEVIIVALATDSLAKWIQIVGRGARITDKIEKPYFLVIDGGNNTTRHQSFDAHTRDWGKIFSDKEFKVKTENDIKCIMCGFMYDSANPECPNCGEPTPNTSSGGGPSPEGEAKQIRIDGSDPNKPPQISIEFMEMKKNTKNKALDVLSDKWITFLEKKRIDKKWYRTRYSVKKDLDRRIRELIAPEYQKIENSKLQGKINKKCDTFVNSIIKKYYDKHF